MLQLKLVQDWGNNHLYLRKHGVTTRINTIDQAYRDMANPLIIKYDIQTLENSNLLAS